MTKDRQCEWGAPPPRVVTPWAHEMADETYVKFVRMPDDLTDVERDCSILASALQRAYDRGVLDGKQEK